MEAIALPRIRIVAVALLAVLAASSLAVRGLAADQSGELAATQRQLAQVEAVLRDARANAVAVTAALDQANAAVATARQRLQAAQARLAAARSMRAAAELALTQVTNQARATQMMVDSEVRAAYMSGGTSSLAMLVNAENLPDLVDRTVTLNHMAGSDHDTLQLLEQQRRQVAATRAQLAGVERERAAATASVAAQVAGLERVQTLRQQAKQKLDAKLASLAGQAASLRAHSSELRQLIQQEQAQQAAAAQSGPPASTPTVGTVGGLCDLSGTSPAEHWIIMHESGGDPRAQNPSSTAFGLGQLLLGNRILYLGQDYATIDCGKQLTAFRDYVRDRYATAEAAQAFWEAHGWY
jgi:septal ring factor EnvC (AmiA/AmiB activator)